MQAVVLEYFEDADRNGYAYKAAENDINQLNGIKCSKLDDLMNELNKLNTDNEPCLLTILTHGHVRGITIGTYISLIEWDKLCEIVNRIQTNYPLKLNLIGVCNSYLIGECKPTMGSNIERIWVSNDNVFSITKALLLHNDKDFNTFISKLDETERLLYSEII